MNTTPDPALQPNTITTRNRSGQIVRISIEGEAGEERRKILMKQVLRGELELWTEDGS